MRSRHRHPAINLQGVPSGSQLAAPIPGMVG